MENLIKIINDAFIAIIIIGILFIYLTWLFIASAVKHGVKTAIEEIQNKNNNADIEEEIKKELDGWN